MGRVCVFLGSAMGASPNFASATARLGQGLVDRGLGLVYGGGSIGLMGVLADAALQAGGEVIGVIPQALAKKEILHEGLTDLRIVDSMHVRKAVMADLADSFLVLPGGLGTLDEWCEILTWRQLGIHDKPCGLLNTEGYFDPFLAQFEVSLAKGFVKAKHRSLFFVETEPEALLDALVSQPMTKPAPPVGEATPAP